MAQLLRFLVGQTEVSAAALARRQQLVSGIVLRVEGAQVQVNVAGQTLGCLATLGLPLLVGDQVLVRQGFGQPMIVAVGPRNSEVA